MTPRPLVVDLDGTLINTDLLHESILIYIQNNLLKIFNIFIWLFIGKANLKRKLALSVDLDVSLLPFNHDFIMFLKHEHKNGRKLVLATGADEKYACKISDYLGIFSSVFASNGSINLTGYNKRKVLVEQYGKGGYDYAGNCFSDLDIWSFSNKAIIVNGNNKLIHRANKIAEVSNVFTKVSYNFSSFFRAIRIHQWVKNILVFVPFFLAHEYLNLDSWGKAFVTFFTFGLSASIIYIINDLIDLSNDRKHRTKRSRPFASGELSIISGITLIPLLLSLCGISLYFSNLSINFIYCLCTYITISLIYSLYLKRIAILDLVALAMLYNIRIIAGAMAVTVDLSFWLLTFSMFMFFGLACSKRYTELLVSHITNKEKLNGRDYIIDDLPLLLMFGASSGLISILVLAFYINSEAISNLYQYPEFIWAICPIMLYWITRFWMLTHRKLMHDDPIVFALKDRASLFALLFISLTLLMAN